MPRFIDPGLAKIPTRPSWTRCASDTGRDRQEASERDTPRSFAAAISSPTPRAQSRVSVVGDIRVGSRLLAVCHTSHESSSTSPAAIRIITWPSDMGRTQDPSSVEPVPLAAAHSSIWRVFAAPTATSRRSIAPSSSAASTSD